MDFYKIKSTNPADYMTVVREMEDGFIVKIVRDRDGYEEVITDFLSKTSTSLVSESTSSCPFK